MKKKELLTVSQLSKLRNVSIDTLRYYDKMEVFKPFYVDPNSGYRYYSILQYEQLGTIIELRNIGLSVEDIKYYMNNRNTSKSLMILKDQQHKLEDEMEQIAAKVRVLQSRILDIEQFQEQYQTETILVKQLPARCFQKFPHPVNIEDARSFSYSVLSLESQLNETLPLIASQRVGHVMDLSPVLPDDSEPQYDNIASLWNDETALFILKEFKAQTGIPSETYDQIEAGTYVCTTYSGLNKDAGTKALSEMLRFCRSQGFTIADRLAWSIIQIDTSITNLKEEAIYEIQLRIEDALPE